MDELSARLDRLEKRYKRMMFGFHAVGLALIVALAAGLLRPSPVGPGNTQTVRTERLEIVDGSGRPCAIFRAVDGTARLTFHDETGQGRGGIHLAIEPDGSPTALMFDTAGHRIRWEQPSTEPSRPPQPPAANRQP